LVASEGHQLLRWMTHATCGAAAPEGDREEATNPTPSCRGRQALSKGAASGTNAVVAMATDEPEADDAAAEPMDDDASDAGDAATTMHRGSGGRGKPGKKRVSDEFRQKVRCSLLPVHMLKRQRRGQRCLVLIGA
jgi:hypothetical protein